MGNNATSTAAATTPSVEQYDDDYHKNQSINDLTTAERKIKDTTAALRQAQAAHFHLQTADIPNKEFILLKYLGTVEAAERELAYAKTDYALAIKYISDWHSGDPTRFTINHAISEFHFTEREDVVEEFVVV